MLVRAGPNVDPSGRCFNTYLENWAKKPEVCSPFPFLISHQLACSIVFACVSRISGLLQGCSLSGLLEALQDIFSREPPVYARPKEPERSVDRTAPPPSSADARPLIPPKPGAAAASPLPSSVLLPSSAAQPSVCVHDTLIAFFRVLEHSHSLCLVSATLTSLRR
jgi:ESCRT-I complex subunit TSG101